jgi:hypothetical protein
MKSKTTNPYRKRIIKPTEAEFALGYQKAPIRQILTLELTLMQQILLLYFFSNDYNRFAPTIDGICKSFGFKKNRADVVKNLNKLQTLGYLITDPAYKVNLEKINADYRLSIAKDDDDSPAIIKTDSSAPMTDSIATIPSDSPAPIADSIPITPPDSLAIILPGSTAITNNRNITERDNRKLITETDKGNSITNLGVGVRLKINTNTDKPSGFKSSDKIPVETTFPAKQHSPTSISKPDKSLSDQPLDIDLSEWEKVFETAAPAKQQIPTETPVNKQFSNNVFTHRGSKVEPVEKLQLVNERFVLQPTRFRGTEYLDFDEFQRMRGLYNDLLNQDIIKYQKLSFYKFERLMLISILEGLANEGKVIPGDRPELQLLVGSCSLDNFDTVYTHFTDDPGYFNGRMGDLQYDYSNFIDRTPVPEQAMAEITT